MALEDLLTPEQAGELIKKTAGKPFGIKPDSKYDRAEFVKKAGDLFDVEEYSGKLRENGSDISTLNDFIKIAVNYMPGGNKEQNALILRDPHTAIEQANSLLSEGYENMSRFVEKNRRDLLNRMDDKQLYSLVRSVAPYQIGNKDHDRLVGIVSRLGAMEQAKEQNQEPSSVLAEEINEIIKNIPKEQQAFLSNRPQSVREQIIGNITQYLASAMGKSMESYFKDKNDKKGKLDRGKMISYLEDHYKYMENQMEDKEIPEDKRPDIWDKNLKPQYIQIAKVLLKSEKKAYKHDKNPKWEDKKAELAKKGIRT